MLIQALIAVSQEPATTTAGTLARRLNINLTQARGVVREVVDKGWAEEVGGVVLLTEQGERQVGKTSAPVPKFFRDKEEPKRLSPTALKAWNHISRNPGARPEGVAAGIGVSKPHARNLIKALKESGQIEEAEGGGYNSTQQSTGARLRGIRDDLRRVLANVDALIGE